MVYADQPQPLAGVYRLGFWYDSEDFSDQHFDNEGNSLASIGTTGIPMQHAGDWGVYGVIDQMLWASDDDPGRNVSFFTRAMGTPQSDRNLIDFSLNLGLTMHNPLPHRDDDTAGFGMGYAKVSGSVSALDQDTAAGSTTFFPVRTQETFLELTYQYQVTPWWQLQPDFQYVFNPAPVF